MKKILLTLSAVLISANLFAIKAESNRETPPLFARSRDNIGTKGSFAVGGERVNEIREIKDEWVDRRCKIVTTNIDTKINRFNNNENLHQQYLETLKTRLSALADKLSSKGYDVTQLKADLATLDTKIEKFTADFADYISKLKTTQGSVCGHSEGEFATELKTARTELAVVRQDLADIRNFYQTTIRADIKALKAQKPVSTTGTTEE